MTTGINLGCGRATFPTTQDNPFTGHLFYALQSGFPQGLDASVDWINVDRIPGPNIHETINLFRFPFMRSSNGKPFEDNSADCIWLSHIIEHIPHAIRLSDYAGGGCGMDIHRKLYDMDSDGWYAFFYECWRILKPGGRMGVIFPYGNSLAALGDPTHTRYIMPTSFSYFQPNPDAPFDYDLPFVFRQFSHADDPNIPDGGMMKVINETFSMREAMEPWENEFDALPADDPRRSELKAKLDASNQYIAGYMGRHFSQIEEAFFVFQAIK